MAISSENLKLRMFHEITKHDKIYIKHDHRNINQIIWLISKDVPREKHIFIQVVLYTFSIVTLTINITQPRATYCIKWNPWTSYAILLKKKNFTDSFLAYLISKHYISNCIVLITITSDQANWLQKKYNFSSLHFLAFIT